MNDRILAVAFSGIMGLNVLMLLLDEQVHIFPYLFGWDIRYLFSIGMIVFTIGATLVVKGLRRFHK